MFEQSYLKLLEIWKVNNLESCGIGRRDELSNLIGCHRFRSLVNSAVFTGDADSAGEMPTVRNVKAFVIAFRTIKNAMLFDAAICSFSHA